jgi:hypothetical protein
MAVENDLSRTFVTKMSEHFAALFGGLIRAMRAFGPHDIHNHQETILRQLF